MCAPCLTYRLTLEYDGRPYCGWQRQCGVSTVQQTLEEALATALRERVSVTGAGRTDSGVHARGQVAHFVVKHALDAARLVRSLNGLLPSSIAILELDRATEDFHARFEARQRRYHYYVSTAARALDAGWRLALPTVPDFALMNDAASVLRGTRHFGAFCRTQSDTENRVCTVERAQWMPEDRPGDWHFGIVADRFLHGMVRTVIGTLLEVGRGRRAPEDLVHILASRDRREAGPAAPPHGLVLESVTY